MATGNTPVMDWSIFNGIRTLSANIAVEIPEAPHAGTLYRTLFLAAALLFAMTFVVNTVAEVIRQRLRERYKADLMATRRNPLHRGDSAIWLAGSGLGICLIMIGGMIGLILTNGLGFFWPRPTRAADAQGRHRAARRSHRSRADPASRARPSISKHFRMQLKLGNRDLTGTDFRWIDEDAITRRERPGDVLYVERREYGPFIGRAVAITDGDRQVATGSEAVLPALPALVDEGRRGSQGDPQPRTGRARRGELPDRTGAPRAAAARTRGGKYAGTDLDTAAHGRADRTGDGRAEGRVRAAGGAAGRNGRRPRRARASRCRLPTAPRRSCRRSTSTAPTPPTGSPRCSAARVYASRLWEFLSGDPRESNTEGGIFPAIFGTVMMVMLMSVLAVPFGVLAALYLREYAKQGFFVRAVRIAVNNLAGVPSIVFGVFGLGFFVYIVGGAIDQTFYRESLPTPDVRHRRAFSGRR